jgi:senataxin
LASLAKLQRTPKLKKQAERRQVKLLELPSNGRNIIQERLNRQHDARRAALRLKPDISELHRTVLSWSYDHDGPDPPISGNRPPILRVPDRFSDFPQYRRVFEPLLHFECWSQIVQSKDEPQESYPAKISSRQFVDDWLSLDLHISEKVNKDWYLTDSDIVLCRHPDEKKNRLAKVQSYKATPIGIYITLRCFFRATADPGFHINSIWCLSKVFR